MEAHLADKPAAPDPVSGYRVNDQADQEAVDTIGRKFCTFCPGTRYDSSLDVAQNTVWKIRNAQNGTPSGSIAEP